MKVNIYCDGGARGNPGPAAAAFLAYNKKEKIFDYGHYLGETTNNVAEYKALYMAMKWLRQYSSKTEISSVIFHLDSELVVKQINGIYKIKNQNLNAIFKKIAELKNGYDFTVKFVHIPRKKNAAADALVNETLDNTSVSR